MATDIAELLERWDSPEGHPYKGSLIDWAAYEADPSDIGCMCAQGQALHLLGGWSPQKLSDTAQDDADTETAKLLNISRAHAILLRSVNDTQDGAPAIVLTHPEQIIGDHARQVLAFWLALDGFTAEQWDAARAAAGDAAWDAARAAARAAAGDAAWDAARAAARAAAWDAAWASNEIQGQGLMRDRGQPFFFLPMFGFANPESIPTLPADYGVPA
jgi:hypothetical protein